MHVGRFYALPVQFFPVPAIIRFNIPDGGFVFPAFQNRYAQREKTIGTVNIAAVPVGLFGVMIMDLNESPVMGEEFCIILDGTKIGR